MVYLIQPIEGGRSACPKKICSVVFCGVKPLYGIGP